MVKLSIIIPVKNEGMNLRVMLRILRAVVEVPYEILVVHDDPDDDSLPVVREFHERDPRIRAVYNQRGRGVPNAILGGVAAATGEYVLIFIADDAGPVLAIDEMLRLMDGGCDLVSCTRYAHGGRRLGGSPIGGFLSRLANRLLCSVGGMVLTDATTGVKMVRRSVFERHITLTAAPVGWAVAFELAIKAQLAGLKLGEVPVVSVDRLYGGTSTFRLGQWTSEYLRWFIWGIWHLRRDRHRRSEKPVVRYCPSMEHR